MMKKKLLFPLKLLFSLNLLSQEIISMEEEKTTSQYPSLLESTGLFFNSAELKSGNEEDRQERGDKYHSLWEGLPPEIRVWVCSYFDNNTLLNMRLVNRKTLSIVDKEFLNRSPIKTPFGCLIQQNNPHQSPHTLSYFLRKYLWQIKNMLISPTFNKELSNSLLGCSDFCQNWNFPAKDVMKFMSTLAIFPPDVYDAHIFFDQKYKDLMTVPGEEALEVRLLLMNLTSKKGWGNPSNCDTLCSLILELINLGRKDIAFFYIGLIGAKLEFEKAFVESKKIYQIGVDLGHVHSQYSLGVILDEEGNLEEAKRFYKIAADQGNVYAQYNTAIFLEREGNIEEAKRFCKLAADQGFAMAQFNLGTILEDEGNTEEAKKFYKMAADQGDDVAQYNLGVILEEEGNLEEAKRLFYLAANQGDADAQLNLGIILEREGNMEEAKRLFHLAAIQKKFPSSLSRK